MREGRTIGIEWERRNLAFTMKKNTNRSLCVSGFPASCLTSPFKTFFSKESTSLRGNFEGKKTLKIIPYVIASICSQYSLNLLLYLQNIMDFLRLRVRLLHKSARDCHFFYLSTHAIKISEN